MARARKEVPETEATEVTELIEREKRYGLGLKKYRDAQGLEHDYAIKLVQLDPKKRRELEKLGRQPVVTLDLYDINRYAWSTISGSSIYFDLALLKPGKDAQETADMQDALEVARAAFDEHLKSVDIGYPRVRRRVIRLAQAARWGAAKWDVVTGGPYGTEIVPTQVDPRNLSWDSECYLSPSDYGCPELWETIRPLLSWAKNNPDFDKASRALLVADDGERLIPRSADPAVTEQAPGPDDDGARITLKVGWLKADPEEFNEDVPSEPLPADQWHMACGTCGYSEADLVGTQGYDGSQLPEMQDCPQCGVTAEGAAVSQMHRVDVKHEIGRVPKYNDKHRKVVIAPFVKAAGFLRDGPWPLGLTNFPYMLHVSDPFPLEPSGNSATFLNMDLQSLKNKSLRSMSEQMDRNQDLTVVQEGAFWTAQHEPQQFDGSQGYVAFTAAGEPIGNKIQHYQGAGLNPASGMWMDRLDSEIGRHRGIGQVSADAQQMKGMPVGTVARVQETGDVPLDEMIRILREDEQGYFSRGIELFVAYATVERWVDVAGKDGQRAFRVFKGQDVPPFKLTVHSSPNINAVDMEKVSKMKELIGAPPAVIRFALKDANVPQDVIDELIQGSAPPAGGGVVPNGQPMAPPQPALMGARG